MFPTEHHSSCVEAVARSACPGLWPARVSSSAIAACVPRGTPGSGSPGSVPFRSSERRAARLQRPWTITMTLGAW